MKKRGSLKALKRLAALAGCGLLLLPGAALASNAVTVVEDAKSTAARLRDEAKAIADYHQSLEYLELAKKYVALAENNLTEMQKGEAEAKNNLADAETWRVDAENWLQTAEKRLGDAQEALRPFGSEAGLRAAVAAWQDELQAAENQLADLNFGKRNELAAWQAKIDATAARAAQAALEEVGYDENRLDEAEAKAEAAIGGYQSGMDETESAYEAKFDAAEARRDEARDKLAEAADALSDFLALSSDAADAAADDAAARKNFSEAAGNLQSARLYYSEAQRSVLEANGDLSDGLSDLAEAKKALEPPEESFYFQGRMQYYSWKGKAGRKGSQLYQPYQFYMTQGNMEYGLQTAYLISDNRSPDGGKMSGLTDTTVSVASSNRKKIYTVTYGLDINLPTGESRMKENAVMDEDLVAQTRFGDGYNYTPRLKVSRKIGEEDTWSLETSYAFKKSYEYNRGLPGAMANPGGEWAKSLEWLHAGQKWQALVVLSHSNYGRSAQDELKDNGYFDWNYREGDQTDAKFYYNRVLTEKQDLMAYYHYSTGEALTDQSGDVDDNRYRSYYGLEWKYKATPKESLRVMFNAMRSTGSGYDTITRVQTSDRRKYSGLIGYDMRLDERSSLSLELEHFYMKDKEGGAYHGNNVFIKYAKNL